MSTKFILDPGSCHLGILDRCLDFVDIAAEHGAALKFQLFNPPVAMGNKIFNRSHWPDVLEYANKKKVALYASVWDEDAATLLMKSGCKYIKFAYSMRDLPVWAISCIPEFEKAFISTNDIFSMSFMLQNVVHLWIDADEKAARYPSFIHPDFITIKAAGFGGYSCHTMNPEVINDAALKGLEWIELHVRLGDKFDMKCNDGKIAFSPNQLGEINGL